MDDFLHESKKAGLPSMNGRIRPWHNILYIFYRRTCLGEEEVGSHLNFKFQIHVPVLSP